MQLHISQLNLSILLNISICNNNALYSAALICNYGVFCSSSGACTFEPKRRSAAAASAEHGGRYVLCLPRRSASSCSTILDHQPPITSNDLRIVKSDTSSSTCMGRAVFRSTQCPAWSSAPNIKPVSNCHHSTCSCQSEPHARNTSLSDPTAARIDFCEVNIAKSALHLLINAHNATLEVSIKTFNNYPQQQPRRSP